MHHLSIRLLHEDEFSKTRNSYIKSAYYSICDYYGVNADKIWINEDWFYTASHSNLGDGEGLLKGHHQTTLQDG